MNPSGSGLRQNPQDAVNDIIAYLDKWRLVEHMRRTLFVISITCILILFGNQAVLCGTSADSFIEVFFNDPTLSTRDRTLQDMILNQINNAQDSIDLVTYNFTDTYTRDALIEAARDGVQVRVVIDEDNGDASIIRDLERAGIKTMVAQSNGLMHSKFIVIDDDITISGSANLTVGSFFYDICRPCARKLLLYL